MVARKAQLMARLQQMQQELLVAQGRVDQLAEDFKEAAGVDVNTYLEHHPEEHERVNRANRGEL